MSNADHIHTPTAKRWRDFIPDPPPVEDGFLRNPVIEDIGSILRLRFKPSADSTLIAGRSYILYDANNPAERIAPDYYVVFGVDVQTIIKQNGYRLWQWRKPPDFVLQVATESSAIDDLTTKRDIYAQIGAREYWRFDPTDGKLYGQPLTGERLANGKYEPYPIHTNAAGDIWARSETLELDFYKRRNRFWVKDSETGEWLNFLEAEIAAHKAEKAAHEATKLKRKELQAARQAYQAEIEAHNRDRQARLQAEAQARELQAEIDRLRQSR